MTHPAYNVGIKMGEKQIRKEVDVFVDARIGERVVAIGCLRKSGGNEYERVVGIGFE